jgi:pectate lyase
MTASLQAGAAGASFGLLQASGLGGMLQNWGANNVTIRNIEFDGNNENPPQTNGPEDGLRFFGGAANNIVEHCYIHDYATWETDDEHQDGVQAPSATNITFRNVTIICAGGGRRIFSYRNPPERDGGADLL